MKKEVYIGYINTALSVLPQAELERIFEYICELYSLDVKGGADNGQ